MTKNDLLSLLDSNSLLDYPILTPLVSFVSLCESFEAGLIHSLETVTLTDIDHVSIMNVIEPLQIPIFALYVQRVGDRGRPIPSDTLKLTSQIRSKALMSSK